MDRAMGRRVRIAIGIVVRSAIVLQFHIDKLSRPLTLRVTEGAPTEDNSSRGAFVKPAPSLAGAVIECNPKTIQNSEQ